MDLREAIVGRRSIRAFTGDPVSPQAIDAMKEAVLWAPSAGNEQARRFYFVTAPEVRQALGTASYQPELFVAPLVVVGCTDERITVRYGARGVELFAKQDVAAAVQNLLLTVHAEGLGAVWVGAFEPAKVTEILRLEPELEATVMVPVGVPAEAPAPPARLDPARVFTDVT